MNYEYIIIDNNINYKFCKLIEELYLIEEHTQAQKLSKKDSNLIVLVQIRNDIEISKIKFKF